MSEQKREIAWPKYPFESFPWDDSPSNNNRWVDAAEAEKAYDALASSLSILESKASQFESTLAETIKVRDALAAENENLKQKIASLNEELSWWGRE